MKNKEQKIRKKLWFLLIGIFLMALMSFKFTCPKGQQRITRVIDGDTFDTEEGRIRLLGIDAYDKKSKLMIERQAIRTGYTKERVKNFGILATNYAEEMLLDKCVILESDYKGKGRYGRLLRYVSIEKEDFGSLVLKKGLGNAYCGDKKIKKYEDYNKLSDFKCK